MYMFLFKYKEMRTYLMSCKQFLMHKCLKCNSNNSVGYFFIHPSSIEFYFNSLTCRIVCLKHLYANELFMENLFEYFYERVFFL